MSSFHRMIAAFLAGALASGVSAGATQTTLEPSSATSTVQDELLRMAGQAGVIFAGEVLGVTQHPSFTPGTGFVEIAFRIDQPIRGCDGQSIYTLREWAGLWTAGRQRYTPGQRLLVLLHTPSASGLSSPVGGQEGMIPISGTGVAPKPNDTFVAQAEPAVDLRWVQARLPRTAALLQNNRPRSLVASRAYTGRDHAPSITRKLPTPGTPRSVDPVSSLVESSSTLPLSSTTAPGISLRGILAILGAWQAQQSNASH